MKILNIYIWYCLFIIFPNVTGKYVLHPIFAVRMYPFYGHFNAHVAGLTILNVFHQSIIVAFDSTYFKTKTTPC